MPPLESRFKTVTICLDAVCLDEPAKLNMTKTTVRVFAIVATFAMAGSRDEPPSVCRCAARVLQRSEWGAHQRTKAILRNCVASRVV